MRKDSVYSVLIVALCVRIRAETNDPKPEEDNPYIIGGEEAAPNEFPFLLHIASNRERCGGILIAWDMVLTAAHCVLQNNTCEIVPLNKISVSAQYDEAYSQTREAAYISVHENHSPHDLWDDIALIKLTSKFDQVNNLSLARLSSLNNVNIGTVAGWGYISDNGTYPSRLMKVTTKVVNSDTCNKAKSCPKSQFCAGNGKQGACNGDSGGPFMCDSNGGVCGLVSYNPSDDIGCTDPSATAVFTRLEMYLDWIIKQNTSFKEGTCSGKSSACSSYIVTTTTTPSSSGVITNFPFSLTTGAFILIIQFLNIFVTKY